MTNEEHRTKNNVEVDYSRNSAVPRLHFLFFLLLLPYFSQNLSKLNARTLYSASLMPIYSKKMAFGTMAARLGELLPSALSNLGAQASQRLAWAS